MIKKKNTAESFSSSARILDSGPLLNEADYFIDSNITTPAPAQTKLYNNVGVIVPKKFEGGLDANTWTLVTKTSYVDYTDVRLDFYDTVYLINNVTDQATLDTALTLSNEFVRTIVPCDASLLSLNYDAYPYVVIVYSDQITDELTSFVNQNYHACFYAGSHNEGLWAVTSFLQGDGIYPNLYKNIKGKDDYFGIKDPSLAKSINLQGYSNYASVVQGKGLDYFNVAGYTAHVAYGTAYLNFNIKQILMKENIRDAQYSDLTAQRGKLAIETFLESIKSQDNSFISDAVQVNGQVIQSYSVSFRKTLQDTESKQVGHITYDVEVLFVGYVKRITLNLSSLF